MGPGMWVSVVTHVIRKHCIQNSGVLKEEKTLVSLYEEYNAPWCHEKAGLVMLITRVVVEYGTSETKTETWVAETKIETEAT